VVVPRAPFTTVMLFLCALAAWVATLLHAARNRRWAWLVVALLLPGIGMVAYWIWFAINGHTADA
jgi:hypothetical protein